MDMEVDKSRCDEIALHIDARDRALRRLPNALDTSLGDGDTAIVQDAFGQNDAASDQTEPLHNDRTPCREKRALGNEYRV